MDDLPLISDLTIIFALLFFNAIFTAAESVLASYRLKGDAPELKNSSSIKSLFSDYEHSMIAAKIGTMTVSVAVGWWGMLYLSSAIESHLLNIDDSLKAIISHSLAVLISLLMIVLAQVLFGEIIGRSFAASYPKLTLKIVSYPVLISRLIVSPMHTVMRFAVNSLLSVFRGTKLPPLEHVYTPDELSALVSHSTLQGELDKEEEQMLHSILGFSDTVAREVMTPRTELTTVPFDANHEFVMETIRKTGLSRLPVVGEGVDDIIGVILAKDFLAKGFGLGDRFDVRRLMREPYFIPGTKSIDELLTEFKLRKLHMAIVLDEHGGVDGVVTLEDLLEEIVGEIFDESDTTEKDIIVNKDGSLLVDGGVLVEDLNSAHGLNIPLGEYDTIAGYVFTHFGRVPVQGDEIQIEIHDEDHDEDDDSIEDTEPTPKEVKIVVDTVSGHRIEKLRIKPEYNGVNSSESRSRATAS